MITKAAARRVARLIKTRRSVVLLAILSSSDRHRAGGATRERRAGCILAQLSTRATIRYAKGGKRRYSTRRSEERCDWGSGAAAGDRKLKEVRIMGRLPGKGRVYHRSGFRHRASGGALVRLGRRECRDR